MKTLRFAFALAVLAISITAKAAFAAGPPNVVLVVTDDQGYGDLGCLGNPVLKTPHLDALYRESVRLTDYHVSPTCSPTRAALQTGHWTNRTGAWHTIMGRSILRADEVTMGDVFLAAGYATGMFGKWHLGDNYPYRPEDRGYGEVMRHGGGGVGQTPDYWDNAYFDGSYFHNSKPVPVEGYCTDVFFDYAERFIAEQHAAGRPFFAYICTNAPHGPMHAPEAYSEPYQANGTHVANFLGMIANIDDNVGKLRRFLADEGLDKNTLFIFTTDNGTSSGHRVFNAGMRGNKGSPYDGGHRVPFFAHWPAGGLTGGRDVTPLTAHVDILPTLIDLCGIEPSVDLQFDGVSLRPLLDERADPDSAEWSQRMLITDSQRVKDPIKWRQSSVMTSRWRLINGSELYDMPADPGQQKDVAGEHPDVVRRLRDFYDAWWTELEPTFAQDCPLYLGHSAENPATLTCHDWITTSSTPWNQRTVRAALDGKGNTGFWNVKVVEPGRYEIGLRRWPRESGTAIDAGLPAGEKVPGERAFRAVPGKAVPIVRATLQVGDQQLEMPVPAGAAEVVFNVELPAGDTRLAAQFHTADSHAAGNDVRREDATVRTMIGAYYAYVLRKD